MKIAYISGTRADFGLMTSVLQAIDKSDVLKLQLYVTGMHLIPLFGETAKIIEDQFASTKKIFAIFENDQRESMAKFASVFQSRLIEQFKADRPDFVLVLGDRVEMLSTCFVCLYLGIPVGHLHGGEKTSTVDEVARHAITKLSSLHFAATEESAQRILKMGEDSWRIHVVGAPALDTILNEKLPTKVELFKKLSLNPNSKLILITQHAVSGEENQAEDQISKTIEAVKSFNLPTVIIYPNADSGGRRMIMVIRKQQDNPLFRILPNLEYRDFLALEREASVWVGNSSGALIESSSFKIPVVNIGTRQKGRQRGDNVIDVNYNIEEIRKGIEESLHNKDYLAKLSKIKNPWGDGKTGERVRKILEEMELGKNLLKKQITY